MRPIFCRGFGEANELTTNAQRAASALDGYSAHADRRRQRALAETNQTNVQRVARARNKWSAHHVTCMLRWTCVRSTQGVPSVCSRCSLDHSRRAYNGIHSVCSACLALVQRTLRKAGLLQASTFMRRAPRTFVCMHIKPSIMLRQLNILWRWEPKTIWRFG